MKYSFSKQEESLLGHLENKNEFASYFTPGSPARDRLDKARKFISTNRKLEEKAKIWKRFDKASLLEEYKTTYNELCRSTHNNIDMVISNHIKNGGKDVIVHDQSDVSQLTRHIELGLGICLTSAKAISMKYAFANFDLTNASTLLTQFRDMHITPIKKAK